MPAEPSKANGHPPVPVLAEPQPWEYASCASCRALKRLCAKCSEQTSPAPAPTVGGGEKFEWKPDALKFASLAEIESRPQADASWLVDGMLPDDGVSLWFATAENRQEHLEPDSHCCCCRESRYMARPQDWPGVALSLALEERLATVVGHYKSIEADVRNIMLMDQAPPEPSERPKMLEAAITAHRPR